MNIVLSYLFLEVDLLTTFQGVITSFVTRARVIEHTGAIRRKRQYCRLFFEGKIGKLATFKRHILSTVLCTNNNFKFSSCPIIFHNFNRRKSLSLQDPEFN